MRQRDSGIINETNWKIDLIVDLLAQFAKKYRIILVLLSDDIILTRQLSSS